MAKASQEELNFLENFVRWWREAGIVYYGEGTRDQDDGLISMAEQAKAILENRRSEPHSIPEPGTPHNNPRMPGAVP